MMLQPMLLTALIIGLTSAAYPPPGVQPPNTVSVKVGLLEYPQFSPPESKRIGETSHVLQDAKYFLIHKPTADMVIDVSGDISNFTMGLQRHVGSLLKVEAKQVTLSYPEPQQVVVNVMVGQEMIAIVKVQTPKKIAGVRLSAALLKDPPYKVAGEAAQDAQT